MKIGKKTASMDQVRATSQMDMSKLESASGREFDRAFIEIMTRHHKDGIQMAQTKIERGEHKEVKRFSEKMINTQNNDISEMNQMRKSPASKKKQP
jgi:uncharacterized protein (DUF305 family)